MILQRDIFVKYLVLLFAVVFGLLRSTQYYHMQPLPATTTAGQPVVKYQHMPPTSIFTRHMEKGVEERFSLADLPPIQFNGIIFLLLTTLAFVLLTQTVKTPVCTTTLSGTHLCTRLCTFRL